MQLQRLSRLSDIIFAGAMTLMALTFEPLPLKDKTPQEVSVFVQEQLPSFAVYVLTFIGIAFYWISHLQQFQYYKQTDVTHIWLTLLSLLFVVVLHYENDFSTVHDGVFVIQCFYSLSVAGVGIFSTAAWIYATQNRRLVAPELSDITIRRIRQETYAEPIVSLLAIGGALIHPWGWILTFILGFPLIFLIQRLFRIEE